MQTLDRSAANNDAEETRSFIVEQSIELFAHYGYSKTNIGDIAQACSMSAGNLYRYFRNKQAIGHAVIASFFARENTLMNTAMEPPGSAEERIRAVMTAAVMHIVEELRRAARPSEAGGIGRAGCAVAGQRARDGDVEVGIGVLGLEQLHGFRTQRVL